MATNGDPTFELLKCKEDAIYFIYNYCLIQVESTEGGGGAWIPFHLWPAQVSFLDTIKANKLVIALKARQLGFSWLVIAYALWLMLFRASAFILIFSRRDDEATDLLVNRLKGMYDHLPNWFKVPSRGKRFKDNDHQWTLANGSRAIAFPTTGGRSYTASFVLVDEADYIPHLEDLLSAVKPTIDANGQLVLLSTSDKTNPESEFKKIYRSARSGTNDYVPIFHSWDSRPDRNKEWYEAQVRNTPSMDKLWQEYPRTDLEALSANVLDKRIDPRWLEQCYTEARVITTVFELGVKAPSIPGLKIYKIPMLGKRYVIGGDTSEGNPTSDPSSASVLEVQSGEEVATLTGLFQPSVFASHLNAIGVYYHHARLMIERNNHGHAVLLWLDEHSNLPLLSGHDGKVGWLSSEKGKALLYDSCADAFRNSDTILHTFGTLVELQSIEGATLKAPEGQHDDKATGYALAIVAMIKSQRQTAPPVGLGGGVGVGRH